MRSPPEPMSSPQLEHASGRLSTAATAYDGGSSPCAAGDALIAAGRPEAALDAYQVAIEDPQYCVAGHIGQAKAYAALGRPQDAIESLEVALALQPDAVDALALAARLRRKAGEVPTCLQLLRNAIELAPERAELYAEQGLALNAVGLTAEAIDAYRTAIALDPEALGARVNLGLIFLLQLGDPVRAEQLLLDALAHAPDFVPAIANLGLALQDQGRHEEAIELYRRARLRHPDDIELRWNLAIAHLSLGEFASGWEGYELRLRRPGGRNLARFPFQAWDGGRLSGRLLVLAEQGLGDEIMFASCLPDLEERTNGVVLECAPRLAGLFARSFPRIAVHGADRHDACAWLAGYPDIQAQSAIGSLPRWLRTSPESFPRRSGYLRADPCMVKAYRQKLAAAGAGMAIGLSWRAGTRKTREQLRSISLQQLRPVLAIPNCRFVCLQHGLDERARDEARAAGLIFFDEAIGDLDRTAALICALDLVLTTANTNAHLCGALGRPGWVLLDAAPEWRWMRAGERSLWYPSLELLRCARGDQWSELLRRVAGRLGAHAAMMTSSTSRERLP